MCKMFRFKLLGLGLFLAFLIFGLGSVCYAKSVITLTYANFFPATNAHSKLAEEWIKSIETQTNGRVKIDYYSGGVLLKGPHMFDGVKNGIADIGMSCFAYNGGRFPVMGVVDLPWGYPNATVATDVANRFFAKFKPAELNDVKVLYLHAHGPGVLFSKKMVKTLEDLKGLKIRATGFSAKVAEALGAVAVVMSQGMAYEALQRGVVDGSFSPLEVLEGWRQAEVVKYVVLSQKATGYTTAMYVIMNKSKWDMLPEDIKKIFEEVSSKFPQKHAIAWNKGDKRGEEFAKKCGVEFITLSDKEITRWKDRTKQVITNYLSYLQKKGFSDAKKYFTFVNNLLGGKSD